MQAGPAGVEARRARLAQGDGACGSLWGGGAVALSST